MNDILITLKGLLSTIKSDKSITVNLFNENDLLLITFILDGYLSLEDDLESDEVIEITFPKLNTINIKINTNNG